MDALRYHCYGMILQKTLEDIGFKLNSYGRCVANKEIGGKNCMVDWYVDDNKLNHMEPFVN